MLSHHEKKSDNETIRNNFFGESTGVKEKLVYQSTNLSYKTLIMKSTHHLMQKKFHTSSDHDSIETTVDVDTPAKNIRYVGS